MTILPTDTTRLVFVSEPSNTGATGLICQAAPESKRERAVQAFGILLIGSQLTIEGPIIGLRERLSIRQHIHCSYLMPSDDILAEVRSVFVYDIEDSQRFRQLAHCCKYQRRDGGIKSIRAVMRAPDLDLAERIEAIGAQFRLLGEASF